MFNLNSLRSQEEITKCWEEKYSTRKVSICCTVYNHEPYLEDTLVGFLSQETNFPFEVLIHDDASTDASANIINKYETKYPLIIKPIYQTENRYSQGIRVNFTYNYLRAEGKYIALCEGDDFWTDKHKLQKQVDLLEKYNEIILCVHSTGVFKIKENKIESKKIRLNNGDKVINATDVILGGGEFGHTSSFVFRRNMIIDPPRWYTSYPSGDTPTRLLAAAKGQIYYLDNEMSTYRQGVKGSWTKRMNNAKKYVDHWGKAIEMFDEYDQYTEFKYSKVIRKRKSNIAYKILDRLIYELDFQEDKKRYYSLLMGREKTKYLFKAKFPSVFNILKSFK